MIGYFEKNRSVVVLASIGLLLGVLRFDVLDLNWRLVQLQELVLWQDIELGWQTGTLEPRALDDAQALLQNRDDVTAQLSSGMVSAFAGDEAKAMTLWSQIENRPILYALGQGAESAESWQTAIQLYEQAMQVESAEPGLSNLHYHIGRVLHKAVDPPDLPAAREAYEQALQLKDYRTRGWQAGLTRSNLGQLCSRQEDYKCAIEQFEAALISADDPYRIHHDYAVALWQNGNTVEAIDQLEQAIALAPERPLAYWRLGRFYEAEGRTNKAIEMYEAVLERDPTDKQAQQALDKLKK